jgi:hypothetical protein
MVGFRQNDIGPVAQCSATPISTGARAFKFCYGELTRAPLRHHNWRRECPELGADSPATLKSALLARLGHLAAIERWRRAISDPFDLTPRFDLNRIWSVPRWALKCRRWLT